MDMTDWITVLVGALAGWALVSLVGHLVRQQRRPPVDLYGGLPATADTGPRDTLSVGEISDSWHQILGVPESASAKEIEDAYHLRIAECDRIRFSPSESSEQQKAAATRRLRVNQAYEFIRPLRRPP
jgi:hypothetical protein